MSWPPGTPQKAGDLALRLGLGGLFVWAGLAKLSDPNAFAVEIGHYELLPALAPYLAAGLPVTEIVLGLALIVAPVSWRRGAALASLLLMGVFTVAASSAYARGLDIDCGCFGKGTGPITWVTLVRDAGLLACLAILVRFAPAPSSPSAGGSGQP